MQFLIRMGIPEMEDLWSKLQSEYRSGTISKKDTSLYKKWGKALKLLSDNPRHPGLRTHDIEELTSAMGNAFGSLIWRIRLAVLCDCSGCMGRMSILYPLFVWSLTRRIKRMVPTIESLCRGCRRLSDPSR